MAAIDPEAPQEKVLFLSGLMVHMSPDVLDQMMQTAVVHHVTNPFLVTPLVQAKTALLTPRVPQPVPRQGQQRLVRRPQPQ